MRKTVLFVAIANLAYFFVEYFVGRKIGSVSLFADSIDFLEDASVNLLILAALGWSAKKRSAVGMALAALLLVPSVAALWTAWNKFFSPVAPDARLLSLVGSGALVINVSCAFLLAKYRKRGDSLSRAAFYSARNDALANIAIISAGIVTRRWVSGWPDLIVGIGIALLNAGAAKEVWDSAHREWKVNPPLRNVEQ